MIVAWLLARTKWALYWYRRGSYDARVPSGFGVGAALVRAARLVSHASARWLACPLRAGTEDAEILDRSGWARCWYRLGRADGQEPVPLTGAVAARYRAAGLLERPRHRAA